MEISRWVFGGTGKRCALPAKRAKGLAAYFLVYWDRDHGLIKKSERGRGPCIVSSSRIEKFWLIRREAAAAAANVDMCQVLSVSMDAVRAARRAKIVTSYRDISTVAI
ncbi:MAG: hypothetical protein ACREVK_04100 [Gammaproteobacteria bacterium]